MVSAADDGTGERLLGGRYQLQSSLRLGGMSQVWRAEDTLLGRPVAVKVLGGRLAADPASLARFRGQAHQAAKLNHPNIASVYDYGEDGVAGSGQPLVFLVMELVQGQALADLLTRWGRLEVDRTLRLIGQAAGALAAAHAAGVVHRDVKPGNILLRTDGVVKMTDFGVGWSTLSAPLTADGRVLGAARCLSPERDRGGNGSPAADVYALGLVAYECLSGRGAFQGENAAQTTTRQVHEQPPPLPPDVPGPVRHLIGQALAKEPQQRFTDGAALAAAVQRLLDDSETTAKPPTTSPVHQPVTRPLDEPVTTPLKPVTSPLGFLLPTTDPARADAMTSLPSPTDPATRRRRRIAGTALLAGALLAGALLAAVLLGVQLPGHGGRSLDAATANHASSGTSATPMPSTATPSRASSLTGADLIGRSIDVVQAQLTTAGLQIRLNPITTGALPAGQVTDINPPGQLTAGQTATVTYAQRPAPSLR